MNDYEGAHKRFREARDEYNRIESDLAVARAKLNAAERECSVEWRKVLDDARGRSIPPASQGGARE